MRNLTVLVAVALSACATSGANYSPIVDMRGQSPSRYQSDLAECQAYATQRMDAASGAIVGGVVTALVGALVAPRGYRNEVAGKAGLLGAAGGAAQANETQETIIKRCLAGRGYSVLN